MKYVYSNTEYDKYVETQKIKTVDYLNSRKRDRQYNDIKNRFSNRNEYLLKYAKFGKVLCIGAKTGAEVQAFNELGFEAIGIDLVECKPYVIAMDMMDMKFNYKFDIIYTNAIDHAFDVVKFIKEIKNNIVELGIVVIDWNHNAKGTIGAWEAVNLEDCEEIVSLFEDAGFRFLEKPELPKRYGCHGSLEEYLIFEAP